MGLGALIGKADFSILFPRHNVVQFVQVIENAEVVKIRKHKKKHNHENTKVRKREKEGKRAKVGSEVRSTGIPASSSERILEDEWKPHCIDTEPWTLLKPSSVYQRLEGKSTKLPEGRRGKIGMLE